MHTNIPPSPWIRRWAHLIRPGGTVLDLACGSGRHFRWLASQGHQLTGVDRDMHAIDGLRVLGEVFRADLEAGPWPLAGRRFDAVVVTNYLWRPLWPHLLGALAPGGIYLHETFARGQESVGRPSRDDFLLRHGELLDVCRELRIVAYEDGFQESPESFVQRIAAVAPSGEVGRFALPARYPLNVGPGSAR